MIKIIYVVCINLKSNFLFCILNFYVYDCCSLNHYEGIIFQWQHSTCQSIKLLIYIYIYRKKDNSIYRVSSKIGIHIVQMNEKCIFYIKIKYF